MKVGRHSKYYPGIGRELIGHMAKGNSVISFCAIKDIPYSTFYDWVHCHPHLKDSLDIGKCKTILFWEEVGLMGMLGHIKKFRQRVWAMQMIRLKKWGWGNDENSAN
jgi:hypothetical protein